MVKIPKTDMYTISDRESTLRKVLKDSSKKFTDSKKNLLKIPVSFKKKELLLPSNNYGTKIRDEINPLSTLAEEKGFSPNIFTALYEAVLNAHQHGNKLNGSKKILIGSNITQRNLEFIVTDEGTELNSDFGAFILHIRSDNDLTNGNKSISWYDFSDVEQSDINCGTGTSMMHSYMNEIRYFRSLDLGGMAVYMKQTRKNK